MRERISLVWGNLCADLPFGNLPKAFILLTLLFISTASFAQNDDCIDAINVPPGGPCPNGTQMTAQWDFGGLPATVDVANGSCAGDGTDPTIVPNIWFSFVATGTDADITVASTNPGFGPQITVIEFDPIDGPCNTTSMANTQLFCGDSPANLTGLTPGNTYYIAITSKAGETTGNITTCVDSYFPDPAPPNDDPCTSQPLTYETPPPGTPCVPSNAGTTTDATGDWFSAICPTEGENTVWYSVTVPPGSSTLEINLNNISVTGDVSVLVGNWDTDCTGTFSTIGNGVYCGGLPMVTPTGNTMQFTGLAPGTYWVMVGSATANEGDFLICANEMLPPPGCATNNFCTDAATFGNFGPIATNSGQQCLAGCNILADSEPAIGCNMFAEEVIWYTFTTDGTAGQCIIDISSPDVAAPTAQLFSGNCAALAPVGGCGTGNTGVLNFAPIITANTTYFLAVSQDFGVGGDFDVCIEILDDPSACVIDKTLVVTNASLGSPLSGPFQPGETVTYCYTINQYTNAGNGCQWFQGIVPQFGDCWDPATFNPQGPGATMNGNNYPAPGLYSGTWDWATNVTYNWGPTIPSLLSYGDFDGDGMNDICAPSEAGCPNMPIAMNDILPGGWFNYTNSPSCGGGTNVNNCYGDGNSCSNTMAGPWEFCFDLTTKQFNDCSATMSFDCGVSIYTFSDGETGDWSDSSTGTVCAGDTPLSLDASLNCCQGPVIPPSAPLEYCNGGITIPLSSIPADPLTTYIWTVAVPPGVTGPFDCMTGCGTIINQPVNTSTIASITYTVTPISSDGCFGTPTAIPVIVYPDMNVNINPPAPVCGGDCVTLVPNIIGGSGNYVSYNWDNDVDPIPNPMVCPISTTTYNVTVTDNLGCTGVGSVEVSSNGNLQIAITSDPDPPVRCQNDPPIDLTVGVTGTGSGNYQYVWQTPGPPGFTPMIQANNAGQYCVQVFDLVSGCQSLLECINVTVQDTALLFLNPDPLPIFCEGDANYTVSIVAGGNGFGDFGFDYGTTDAIPGGIIYPAALAEDFGPGCYSDLYTYTNGNGCISTKLVEFQLQAFPDTVMLSCGGGMVPGEVTFDWTHPNATSFEYTTAINGGTASAVQTTTDFSLTQTGLGSGDCVEISVYVPGFTDMTDPTGCTVYCEGGETVTFTCCAENCPDNPPSIDNANASYCVSEIGITFTGTPMGGTFSGSAGVMANGDYDPSVAGVGLDTVIYTFIDANMCPQRDSAFFTVEAETPVDFDVIPTLCALDAVLTLPTSDNNSVTGTWVPATIDPAVNGPSIMATFTPAAGQCASGTTITINIDPAVTPVFAGLTSNYCSGDATIPALPAMDDNAVAGTWVPAVVDNSTSGTYTFTPTGTCVNTFDYVVTIDPIITPAFAGLASNYCSGDATIPALPAMDDNGAMGTWVPAVIDNTTSGSYTFSPTGPCGTDFVYNVTIDPTVTPAFAGLTTNYCNGAAIPALPTMDDNGVAGTWAPATVDNTASGSYTFSPTGPCGTDFVYNVTIDPTVTPAFAGLTSNYCNGAAIPALPAMDDNGVAGTWAPAVVDNTTSGSYTFSPTGPCGTDFVYNVTIDPTVTPAFAGLTSNYCNGAAIPALPAMDDNGVAGTWAPAVVDNTTPGSYTFSPTGPCGTDFLYNVTIDPTVTPAFAGLTSNYCNGAAIPALPAMDDNGVAGTWAPAVVDNTTSGSYTFSPTGPCGTDFVYNVTIDPTVTPAFAGLTSNYCNGAAIPALPAMDDNGVAGTWAPAVVDNTTSGSYTFSPTGPCGTDFVYNVTIDPTVTPAFAGLTSNYCNGAAIPALPAMDDNGVAGTWAPAVVDNTTSGSYTFSPTGPCGTDFVYNVTIDPTVTPAFAGLTTNYCNGAAIPALPAMDDNGVAGTWAPAVVDNTTSGSYTFSPTGPCGTDFVYNVTIDPTVTPAFAGLTSNYCNGAAIPALPAMDDNGVAGTWAPAVVDNTTSGSYTFSPTGPCGTDFVYNVTIDPTVTPAFAGLTSNYCNGAAIPALPAMDDNGVAGIWAPAVVDNTTSGSYTFSPTGPCGTDFVYNVTIDPTVTPAFAGLTSNYCNGAAIPALPAMDDNGVAGTWAPAVVDNTTSGSYTFSPTGPCGTDFVYNVTIDPTVTPAFAGLTSNYCNGAAIPPLPAMDDNGVAGTWAPATVDNTASGSYTFSPTGPCGTDFVYNVTIDPTVTPAFAGLTSNYCNGAAIPALPAMDDNGVAGTWAPATVDNTASGSYTFSPTGPCGTDFVYNITIDPTITPAFVGLTTTYCNGEATDALPAMDDNGVAGTWAPATVDNTTSGAYTFTPSSPCGTDFVLNITINPTVTPAFAGLTTTYCNGEATDALPAMDDNGVAGIWSPAIVSNVASSSYTFSPSGPCGTDFVLNVTINPTVTPTFAGLTTTYCNGEATDALPAMDDNGVAGTWVPATVDNTASGSYTFSPSGPCGTDFVLNVTINPTITPAFAGLTTTYCNGEATDALPAMDDNGVAGTWAPATVDNTTSGAYTFSPSGPCGTDFVLNVTINPTITPTFAGLTTTYCNGEATDALPAMDDNGVAGTWVPATVDNTASGSYTFSPSGPCGTDFVLNVTINPTITPAFAGLTTTYCNGEATDALPAMDDNGVAGTWVPAVVDNTTSGTYTFSPSGPCGTDFVLNVTINPTITPAFAGLTTTYCNGEATDALPAMDDNGVAGTWAPATVDNTTSGAYTFSPSGPCGTDFVLNVTINPTITPAFAGLTTTYCNGEATDPLPAIDDNGVAGTWSPGFIDNTTSGSYTFSPSGPCGTDFVLNVTISPTVIPAFASLTTSYCNGDIVDALPAMDDNGVAGTWSPATVDNTASGSYTFSPSGSCGTDFVFDVTINPTVTPTFSALNTVCEDNGPVALPTTSNNLITGTWAPASFDPTGAAGTTLSATFTPDAGQCAETTTLTLDVSGITVQITGVPTCDDGGTPSDPSDDTFTFEITVSGDNVSGMWSTTDLGGATGAYDTPMTFGPIGLPTADFAMTFMDSAAPGCMASVNIVAPATCSDLCALTIDEATANCDDLGTTSDPADDMYTITVAASAVNGSTDFEVYDGTTLLGTFPYATGGSFMLPANSNILMLTFVDAGDPACTATADLGTLNPCSSTCLLSIDEATAVCNDMGTGTDPDDDTYTITVAASAVNGGSDFEVFNGSTSLGIFSYATGGTFTMPANGDNITLTFVDAGDPACTQTQNIGTLDPCSDDCELSVDAFNTTCDDGGTPSDPDDDIYTISFNVSALNGGGTYDVIDNNTSAVLGNFTYGLGGNFTLPADDILTYSITFQDSSDPLCIITQDFGPLVSCSGACVITSATASNIVCDNNGTASDPSDDTYTFEILVSGANTSATGWSANDPNTTTGGYDVSATFGPYNISDGALSITITDNDNPDCESVVNVTPPATCSDLCVITEATVTNIICNNNGTTTDPSDDTFTFQVVVNGDNTDTGWTANDPNGTTGNFGNAVIFGPYNISDGPLTITISDNTDANCTTDINVDPPMTCSTDCVLTITDSSFNCNDGGTDSDPSDDTYTVTVNATTMGGGTTFEVFNDVVSLGTFDYGTGGTVTVNPGADITLTFIDTDNSACFATTTIGPLPTCSGACVITEATVSNIACDDNGTPSDPSDDTFTFEVTVDGTNGAASGWIANDPNGTAGGYGTTTSFGPYLISGGSLAITISDFNDATCTADINIDPPMTCSGLCVITEATVSNILCDNNGTTTDPSDDTFTFQVLVNGDNTDAAWTANDPNATTGDFGTVVTFGPYPISGGALAITITDNTDANCTTDINVDPPMTCSTDCVLTITDSSFNCNDGGTSSDPSDDTYTVTVNATTMGGGTTFEVFNDVVSLGTFTYGTGGMVTVNPGADVTLTFVDVDNAACFATTTIGPLPTCSGACVITEATVSNILCDDNGTATDPSDDTFTFEVLANGVNGAATGWTANDPNASVGVYGVTTVFGPYNISDGSLAITLTDNDAADCTFDINVDPPATCSSLCVITEATASNITCNDNGTPSDPSDDTYTFDVLVNGDNTATGWTANDPNATAGTYGATTAFGPYNISAGALVITITDNDDTDCASILNIDPPATCSDLCVITEATVTNILCDNNGTTTDPTDDTYTFQVLVNGTNGAASGWTATDPNATTGTYGIAITFGPYNISDGPLAFTIADNDDANCSAAVNVDPPASCSTDCVLTITESSFNCNDGGTDSDPSDDTYTVTVNATTMGGGTSFEVFNDVVSLGIFDYGTGGMVSVPAGADVILTFVDTGNAACFATTNIGPLPTCSGACVIADATVSNILCNDNGTPSDPSDDTFTFDVIVTGQANNATGWNANDPNATAGDYATSTTFGPYQISGGTLAITITDNDDATCTTDISVDPPAPCSGACVIADATVANILCNDNGTPSDPSDDTFTFDVIVTGQANNATGWNANDPNATAGDYATSTTFGPYQISGGTLAITITDNDDATCTTDISVDPPATCSDLCVITEATVTNILCDNNGTTTDPTDDTYTFQVLVNGTNGAASGWTATDPNATTGTYGIAITFGPYNISDGPLAFTIADNDDANCSAAVNVDPPASCSTDCVLTITESSFNCNDGGTDSDPSDDTYTVTVNATTMGGGTSFEVFNDVVSLGIFDYGTGGMVSVPAGADVILTFVDTGNAACFATTTIGPLPTCSGTCVIADATVSNILCNDNGTPSDPSDDTFTFDVIVTGQANNATGWNANDPNATVGDYAASTTFGPYQISGGTLAITITDNDDATCTTDISVDPPAPCSGTCVIADATVSNILCNDNGTPSDPSDDTFTFDVIVTGQANNATGWNANDPNATVGDYAASTTFGPYPISGGTLAITITDNDDATCTTDISVDPPAPCSGTCVIADATVSNILCNDNGTPSDPSDDTFTFDVIVTGQANNATGWNSNDPNATAGDYATSTTFGPYPISGGTLAITITDNDDATCTTDISVDPPAPCSGTCVIADATVSNILCNDNGTPSDPSDDTFTFDVIVTGQANNATGWNANDPNATAGNYGMTTSFGPYPISGGSLAITITDNDDITCTTDISVDPPAPCSGTCVIADATVSNILCNDNGTPSDPSDDTFTFDVIVTGQANNATGWNANDPNATVGDYAASTTFGPYPISGGTLAITITDNDDATCTTDISVDPPAPCSGLCVIADATVSNILCNDNGTPSDPSDDTFTFDVIVTGQANNATGWNANDPNATAGDYAVSTTFGPYPISGGTLAITITDNDDATCTTDISVDPPMTCSGLCVIANATVSNILCDDNGTNSDPSDDTFTFDVIVTGQANNATGWNANDPNATAGNYGMTTSFGPYPISGGSLAITITDNDDITCTTDISVDPPATCSGVCVLTVDMLTQGLCDNQGTLNDSTDDTFDATINISAINGTGTYNVTAGALSWGPFNYGDDAILTGIPANGTDITLTITDAMNPGCTITATVNQASCSECNITADAGFDAIINCDSMGVAQILGTGTPGANYIWIYNGIDTVSTGSLGFTATVDGEYTLVVSISDDCFATDMMEVFLDNLVPQASAGPTQLITCLDDNVDLVGSANIADALFEWNTGETTSTINVTTPGTYTLTVTSPDGTCPSPPATVTVIDSTDAPIALIVSNPLDVDTLDCLIQSIDLIGSGVGNATFSWFDETNNQTIPGPMITANDPGNYVFTVVDVLTGCESIQTIQLFDGEAYPPILFNAPLSLTCLEDNVTIDATPTDDIGGNVIFQWYTSPDSAAIANATDLTLEVSFGGSYILTAVDTTNGCTNSETITVESNIVLPMVAVDEPEELDCITTSTILDGSGSEQGVGYIYNWTDGNNDVGTGLTFLAEDGGDYTFIVTNPVNSCSDSITVTVPENTNVPAASLVDIQLPSCNGENDGVITIENVIGGTPPYAYAIDDQNYINFNVFPYQTAGSYTLNIQDAAGCEYDTLIVVNDPPELVIDLGPDIELQLGDSTQLSAQINIPTGAIDTILWTPIEFLECDSINDPNCLEPYVNILQTTQYNVTLIDTLGCEGSDFINVFINKERLVFIPTAFSPNGDGDNDLIQIFGGTGVEKVTYFRIFDRWGETVFSAEDFLPNDPAHGWDGMFKGQAMNPQVFVYVAEIVLTDGQKVIFEGDFTLLR